MHVLEGDDQAGHDPGSRQDLQRQLRDDCQRTLASDDQVLEVVACAGLADVRPETGDRAVREDRFDRVDIVFGRSVQDRAHAAGVGGDVAADRSELLARIRRIQKAPFRACISEVKEQYAGLDRHGHVVRVERFDVIELLRAEQHASVKRHGRSRFCRPRATGRDRNAVFVADLHHCRDLLRARRDDQHIRHMASVDLHLVVAVILIDLVACIDMAGRHLLQLRKNLRRDLLIGPHGSPPYCLNLCVDPDYYFTVFAGLRKVFSAWLSLFCSVVAIVLRRGCYSSAAWLGTTALFLNNGTRIFDPPN